MPEKKYTSPSLRVKAAEKIKETADDMEEFAVDDELMDEPVDEPAVEEAPPEVGGLGPADVDMLSGIAGGYGFSDAQVADIVKIVDEFMAGKGMGTAPVEDVPVEEEMSGLPFEEMA